MLFFLRAQVYLCLDFQFHQPAIFYNELSWPKSTYFKPKVLYTILSGFSFILLNTLNRVINIVCQGHLHLGVPRPNGNIGKSHLTEEELQCSLLEVINFALSEVYTTQTSKKWAKRKQQGHPQALETKLPRRSNSSNLRSRSLGLLHLMIFMSHVLLVFLLRFYCKPFFCFVIFLLYVGLLHITLPPTAHCHYVNMMADTNCLNSDIGHF